MSVEATLFAMLGSDPRIAAMVADRIYPGFIDQGQENFPALSYQRDGTDRIFDALGATGSVTAQFTLGCWSDVAQPLPYQTAWDLFDLVRGLFATFDGSKQNAPGSAIRIKRVFVNNERDVLFVPLAAEGVLAFGVSCDLDVAYEERVNRAR